MGRRDKFVVVIESTSLYLIGYNQNSPSESTFGNLNNAVEFETLEEAERIALEIGGGTVGTVKP